RRRQRRIGVGVPGRDPVGLVADVAVAARRRLGRGGVVAQESRRGRDRLVERLPIAIDDRLARAGGEQVRWGGGGKEGANQTGRAHGGTSGKQRGTRRNGWLRRITVESGTRARNPRVRTRLRSGMSLIRLPFARTAPCRRNHRIASHDTAKSRPGCREFEVRANRLTIW